MVNFHIFNTGKLAAELSRSDPSERIAYFYLLSTELLLAFLLYYSLFFGAYINWLFFLQAVIVLLITFIGVSEAYRANRGESGREFLVRSVCLLLPITINTTLASVALAFLYSYLLPYIADPSIFWNPNRPLILIDFIWAPVFTAVIFWRLNVHIGRIATRSSPDNVLSSDASKARAGQGNRYAYSQWRQY